jgi:urea transport system substrate-binding protein
MWLTWGEKKLRRQKMGRWKSRSGLRLMVLLAAMCLVVTVAYGEGTKEGGPIKLGFVNMRTGFGSIHAIHAYRAVKLAVDEINEAGGLLGRELILLEEDSHTEVDLGLQKLEKLIKQDKVAATVVFVFSHILQAQLEVANAEKHILLGGGLNEGTFCSHYLFGTYAQPNQWVLPIMDWAVADVGKKAYLIGSDYAWGRGSLAAAKKHLPEIRGSLVGEDYYPLGTTDWAPAIQKIKSASPDWILPMVAGNDYVVFLKQFFDFGLQDKIVVANTIFNEEDSPAFPPAVRDGLMTVSTYFMSVKTPENEAFLKKLRNEFGSDVIMTNFGEAYYDMVHMWAKAVQSAGTTESEAVIKALEAQGPFVGPQGKLQIDPKTHTYVMNTYLGRVNADGSITVVKSLGEVFPRPEIECDAREP